MSTVTVPSAPTSAEDRVLQRVRRGDTSAFDPLYRQHHDDLVGFARSLTRCRDDAEDVVAEAFARVLDLLVRGGGPREGLRPYLFRAVRNLAHDQHRRERRVTPDPERGTADRAATDGATAEDLVMSRQDADHARRALARLPSAWREVTWRVEVMEQAPRHIAAATGRTAHNVSAQAHRARQALRAAYLGELVAVRRPACRPIATRLDAYVRDAVGRQERRRVERHLTTCRDCRAALDEVGVVAWQMARARAA